MESDRVYLDSYNYLCTIYSALMSTGILSIDYRRMDTNTQGILREAIHSYIRTYLERPSDKCKCCPNSTVLPTMRNLLMQNTTYTITLDMADIPNCCGVKCEILNGLKSLIFRLISTRRREILSVISAAR